MTPALVCRVVARKGYVIACGAWGGRFLASALGDSMWRDAFQPRKGHLLELTDPPSSCCLHNGLMELGYTNVCCTLHASLKYHHYIIIDNLYYIILIVYVD